MPLRIFSCQWFMRFTALLRQIYHAASVYFDIFAQISIKQWSFLKLKRRCSQVNFTTDKFNISIIFFQRNFSVTFRIASDQIKIKNKELRTCIQMEKQKAKSSRNLNVWKRPVLNYLEALPVAIGPFQKVSIEIS